MKLEDIIDKLTEYFPPECHKERKIKGGGTWYYLPHQTIAARLNEICPGEWQTDYTLAQMIDSEPVYLCKLTICGVTRTGIGDKSNETSPYGTSAQRAFRKAFTDACEQFGLGAYLDEQTDEKTRKAFVKYMHSAGRGDVVQNYHKNNGNISDRPRSADPPSKPFGKPAPAKSSKTPPKSPAKPSSPPASDNKTRFGWILEQTGHNKQQVVAIAQQLELPTNSANLTQSQADKLRDELYIDWGMSQNKFASVAEARIQFSRVLGLFDTPDPPDDKLWTLWMEAVAGYVSQLKAS